MYVMYSFILYSYTTMLSMLSITIISSLKRVFNESRKLNINIDIIIIINLLFHIYCNVSNCLIIKK